MNKKTITCPDCGLQARAMLNESGILRVGNQVYFCPGCNKVLEEEAGSIGRTLKQSGIACGVRVQ